MNDKVTPIPPKKEPERVYFTDAQLAAALQSEVTTLKHYFEQEKASFARETSNFKLNDQRMRDQVRDLQAKLLASQDRVMELQDKLLSVRSIINT